MEINGKKFLEDDRICQKQGFDLSYVEFMGFPGGASDKESAYQCTRCKRQRFDPWIGKIPWRRAWQTTPVFLSRESHGQRSLGDYSSWGRKESDTTGAT